ncbi:MAG: protein kinase [Blastocatellia bacterium]|nr:protein kinase [Blastocatellia bacterium]
MIGKTISHYRILEMLGAGGMGEVYRAEDLRLHRDVALKVLRSGGGEKSDSHSQESKRRFLREAQAAAALNHPNIATIYSVEEFDAGEEASSFIAMEYVEGKTLSQYAREKNPGLTEAIEIVLEIALALEAAHRRGIIHRDVKPSNVMITHDRRIKVLDFGLAKFVRKDACRDTLEGPESGSLHTTPGLVMGTLAYMSPEQAMGEDVDRGSDIFSLGVLLYELIAGRLPFTGETAVAIINCLLHAEVPALNPFNPQVTPDLERVVRRMLEKDRGRRYADLGEVRRDLGAIKNAKRRYEFGEFQLDVSERLLMRDGAVIDLKPKVFDLLVLLVQNAGRLMEKEAIFQSLWPDTVVEEANLNVSVSALRKALGDTASNPRYIETAPKRGYRFIARVSEKAIAPPPAVVETERLTSPPRVVAANSDAATILGSSGEFSAPPSGVGRANRKHWLAAFAALLLLAAMVVWFWPRLSSEGQPRTIAVLPFKMLARPDQNDADQALALGMTDALITKMSGLPMLIVRPTSSVTKYAGANTDPIAAGRELEVEAVLDGRVQQSEKELRITAQLIRVKDGATLWAGTINDYLTNVFQVQDSISEKMIGALEISLSKQQERHLAKRYTESTEAYQLFLLGQYQSDLGTPDSFDRAVKYYQAAVQKDPEYALAYARLADALFATGEYHTGERKSLRRQSQVTVEKALGLDPNLSEAHEMAMWAKLAMNFDWAGAESQIKQALDLNPNNPAAHSAYAWMLIALGRIEEAAQESETAIRLDPTSITRMMDRVSVLRALRRSAEAETLARKLVELNPQLVIGHRILAAVLNEQGRFDEAIAELMKDASLDGYSNVPIALGVAYARNGMRTDAERVIAERKKILGSGGSNFYGLATIYAALGEKDRAFEWLEKSYQEREIPIFSIRRDSALEPLYSDPRFADMLGRMGLKP